MSNLKNQIPCPNSGSDITIKGTCQFMCPVSERTLREREGLLHKLECKDGYWDKTGSQAYRRPSPRNRGGSSTITQIADIQKTIKEFSRSAAGQNKIILEELRPAPVLEQTVNYLCTEILPKTDEPFPFIYDFIFDRFRSVRQDLVIQRISDGSAIRILETIIKFHVYANYRCRNEPRENFDSFINDKHLFDCLKRLLWLYAASDWDWDGAEGTSRLEFETLNLILNPLTRTFSGALDPKLMNHKPYKTAFKMCLSYQLRNYVKYFWYLKQLAKDESNIFLLMGAFSHIKFLRGHAFMAMSAAYGGVRNGGRIPLKCLSDLLLYTSCPGNDDLVSDLALLGIEMAEDKETALFKPFTLDKKYGLGVRPKQSDSADTNKEFLFQNLSSNLSLLDSKLVPVPASLVGIKMFANGNCNGESSGAESGDKDRFWDD